jgi:hypothetical protein
MIEAFVQALVSAFSAVKGGEKSAPFVGIAGQALLGVIAAQDQKIRSLEQRVAALESMSVFRRHDR